MYSTELTPEVLHEIPMGTATFSHLTGKWHILASDVQMLYRAQRCLLTVIVVGDVVPKIGLKRFMVGTKQVAGDAYFEMCGTFIVTFKKPLAASPGVQLTAYLEISNELKEGQEIIIDVLTDGKAIF